MKIYEFAQAVSPVWGLAINVVFQVIAFKIFKSLTLFKAVVLGFGFGLLASVGFELIGYSLGYLSPQECLYQIFFNVLGYGFLSYCYFSFLGLVESARRTVLMRTIHSQGGALSESEILVQCSGLQMLNSRLARLVRKNQIVHRNGKYFIENHTLVVVLVKTVVAVKIAVIGKRSELDS